jgi:hypothetical protein
MGSKRLIVTGELQHAVTEFLTAGLSAKRFTDLKVGGSDHAFFRNAVFGEIIWRKSIGRPATPQLHVAFTASADSPFVATDFDSPTGKTPPGLVTPYFPVLWDAPEEAQQWRVNVMIPNIDFDAVLRIRITLNDNVAWKKPDGTNARPWLLALDPPNLAFAKGMRPAHFTVNVRSQPFMRLDRSGVVKTTVSRGP